VLRQKSAHEEEQKSVANTEAEEENEKQIAVKAEWGRADSGLTLNMSDSARLGVLVAAQKLTERGI
jgi:hypothetical protein